MNKQPDHITTVRKALLEQGRSELDAREDQPELNRLLDEIEQTRQSMLVARRAASEAAAQPYQEKITELQKQYAFLLRLSA